MQAIGSADIRWAFGELRSRDPHAHQARQQPRGVISIGRRTGCGTAAGRVRRDRDRRRRAGAAAQTGARRQE